MSVPEIDIDELERRMKAGAVVVDVREPDEYEAGHVAGAVLIPLGEVAERAGEIDASGEVLVVCHLGGRSARATEILRAGGMDAFNVAGGTQAWVDSGRPVVTGTQAR